MKKTNKSADGTSFHNVTIKTSVNELIRVLGEPDDDSNTGEDKVNFEWICETENGYIVTIYDWKEYRMIDVNEKIEFHLGGHSQLSTFDGKIELQTLLNK
jgi:hypothetical protein